MRNGKPFIVTACEYSQAVLTSFINKGYEGVSVDLLPCEGDYPEKHIQGDCIKYIEENIADIDILIAFPPCTHLAVSGARHFEKKRADGRQKEGIEFFGYFLELHNRYPDLKLVIENPVNIIGSDYIPQHFPELNHYNIKHTQLVSPHYFGSTTRKKTRLWIYNLPQLEVSNYTEPEVVTYKCKNGKVVTFSKSYNTNAHERSRFSKHFAEAMAEKWS